MGGPAMRGSAEHFSIGNVAHAAKPYHYKECGLDNIYLRNGYSVEEADGDKHVSIKNVDGLWKAIGLKLCTSSKSLSAKEFKFLRRVMGKSQLELANDL